MKKDSFFDMVIAALFFFSLFFVMSHFSYVTQLSVAFLLSGWRVVLRDRRRPVVRSIARSRCFGRSRIRKVS